MDTETIEKGATSQDFDKLIAKWMKSCVRAASLPTLMEIIEPTLPNLIKEIKECHEQGEEYMFKEFKKGLETIIKDKELYEKQNKLDQLKLEAQERPRIKTRLVPTPSQVTMGIISKAKKAEVLRLEKMLQDIRNETYASMNTLRQERLENEQKSEKVASSIKHFYTDMSIASSIPSEDLIDIMKELDLTEV